MQTGVILLILSPSEQTEQLSTTLHSKDIPVLDCTQDEVNDESELIADFVVDNELEGVVVSNTSQAPPPPSLRRAIEEQGLRRHAVYWLDHIVQGQLSEDDIKAVSLASTVNVSRLRHADHAKEVVYRTVPGSSKLSRRDLFRSIPRVLRVESEIPIVLANRCTNRSKSCKYCADACPVNAISEAANGVTINDRACIECGACTRECPIGAIQSPSISDSQLEAMLNTLANEQLENQRALVLTCRKGFEQILNEGQQGKRLTLGTVPVEIPCISSVGTIHHLWAASLGVTLVTVCPDGSCKSAVAIPPSYREAACGTLKTLWGDSEILVRHIGLKAKDPIIDLIHEAIAANTVAPISSSLPEGQRHEVTVEAIRKLRAGGINLDPQLEDSNTLPFFELKVEAARCTFCESCQTCCPDHAIKFTDSGDAVTLMFNPSFCTGCMMCAMNCPEKAITISRLRSLSTIVEQEKVARAQDANVKCENCGASLGSKRNLAALRERLSERGTADSTLKALTLCVRCKQEALIRPLAKQLRT